MNKLILSLILALAALPQLLLAQEDSVSEFKHKQPAIPQQFESKMEEYLFFDNNFNVVQRLRSEEKAKENLMSAEDKKPIGISLFEVDLSLIQNDMTISQFVDRSDYLKTISNGKTYVPVRNSDSVAMNLLRLKFGAPKFRTLGHKVLSRATYYIEPVGDVGGFFAKFVPHIPGLEQKIEREILVNDYIKSQLSKLPPEMRNMTMDSYMAVNLSFLGLPISVAYRSADRIISEKPVGVQTFPGHGLLGCDQCVLNLARRLVGPDVDDSKAVDRWKTKELLPKLAKYMAYANHVLGASFESHTQNMVFEVDTNSGKIVNIYFRDFADVLMSPLPLLTDGRMPDQIAWNKVKLMSLHGQYFSDMGVQAAKDIWYHASIYSGQGVTSHISGFQRQQRHLRVFLENYIAETEKIIGAPVVMSADAKRVMEQLENKVSKADFYSGELTERSPLRNAMASVLKPIFEQVYSTKLAKIENDLRGAVLVGDQSRAAKDFYKLMSMGRVVFMNSEAQSSLSGLVGVERNSESAKNEWLKRTLNAYLKLGLGRQKPKSPINFKIHDGRLWAVDSVTQKPLVATIEVYRENEKPFASNIFSDLKRRLLVIPKPINCQKLFSK